MPSPNACPVAAARARRNLCRMKALLALVLCFIALPALAEVRAVLMGVGEDQHLDADLKGPGPDLALMAEVLVARVVAAGKRTALTTDPALLPPGIMRALPTRDAVIVMLGILISAKQCDKKVSELVGGLPARFTASDRLQNFPTGQSRAILATFSTGDDANDRHAFESAFGKMPGTVVAMDCTDGLRVTFTNDEIIHLRPSGNAPELRCYTEAATNARALEMNCAALERLQSLALQT